MLSDKMNYTVGFVNCFLRVPSVYLLPLCPVPKGYLRKYFIKSLFTIHFVA